MKLPKILHYALWLALVIQPLIPAHSAVNYPSQQIQGDTYESTCAPKAKAALRASLMNPDVANSADAWRLVDMMLCAPNGKATRSKMASVVPKRIWQTVEDTGGAPSREKITCGAECVSDLLAEGRAWDASLQTEQTRIVLHYMANEACIKARIFTYAKGKWSLSELGDACD